MRSLRSAGVVAMAGLALAVAACGESPEDQARDDGENVGEATRAVADATSIDEARSALEELRATVTDLDTDVRERVQKQAETQRDTISAAVDTAQGAPSFDDARVGLSAAAQTLRAQADSFRNGSNSIANEFWRGFEEGYDGDGE